MRYAGTLVALLALTLLSTSAFAISVTPDGYLGEWLKGPGLADDLGDDGTDPTPWDGDVSAWAPKDLTSDPLDAVDIAIYTKNGTQTEDDNVYKSSVLYKGHSRYGGEFYDVEALYIDFEWTADNTEITKLSWALVTSWNGDPSDVKGWDEYTQGRWQPHIALDFGDPPAINAQQGWDFGLVLADSGNSRFGGELAGEIGVVDEQDNGVDNYGTGNFTPTLYDTNDAEWWTTPSGTLGPEPRPYAFDTSYDAVNNPVTVAQAGNASNNYFGLAYEGAAADGGDAYTEQDASPFQLSGWPGDHYQDTNWVWEGTMELDNNIAVADRTDMTVYYTMFCGNDQGGDVISNAPPVPEPASMALLALACTGVGASLKRRRAKK